MKKNTKSIFYLCVLFVILIVIFRWTYNGIESFSLEQENILASAVKITTAKDINRAGNFATLEEDKKTASSVYAIALVGDIMLDRGVESKIYKNNEDWTFPFHKIADFLNKKDLVFGNLEGPVSSLGKNTGKKYSFRHDPKIIESLIFAGFNVVSLANNHIMDYGREAICDSLTNLERAGISSIGAGCDKKRTEQAFIIDLGNTKVGFLAYSEFYNGVSYLASFDLDNMKERIRALKEEEVDLVFISLHWGIEYKTESNEAQQNLGRALIDAGADIIIGHHPHTVQEIEEYKDGWILYSLGNFVFDQSWSEETMKGLLVEVQVQNGEIVKLTSYKTQLNSDFQVGIVE